MTHEPAPTATPTQIAMALRVVLNAGDYSATMRALAWSVLAGSHGILVRQSVVARARHMDRRDGRKPS